MKDDDEPIEMTVSAEALEAAGWERITFKPSLIPAGATLQVTSGGVIGPVCRYKDGAWRPIKTHGDA